MCDSVRLLYLLTYDTLSSKARCRDLPPTAHTDRNTTPDTSSAPACMDGWMGGTARAGAADDGAFKIYTPRPPVCRLACKLIRQAAHLMSLCAFFASASVFCPLFACLQKLPNKRGAPACGCQAAAKERGRIRLILRRGSLSGFVGCFLPSRLSRRGEPEVLCSPPRL